MANLDTRSKRASSVALMLASTLAPVLPDGTLSQGDRQHIAFSYSGIAALLSAPPTDDDATDNAGNTLTVSDYIDHDGAYLRPPRATIRHGFDGANNATLHDSERLDMDRFEAQGQRMGRLGNEGIILDFEAFTSRAGERIVPREIILDLDIIEPGIDHLGAVDTTNRTDHDGANMEIPTHRLRHAPDSNKEGDLGTVGTDQDRFETTHDVDWTAALGMLHHFCVDQSGRAGDAACLREIIVDLDIIEPDAEIEGDTT